MEANEIQEFVEQQEGARENHMMAVSFSISVLAVLVALVTVFSHRAHTAAVLDQARASDEWGLYQAKKIRQTSIQSTSDLLVVLAPGNAAAAAKLQDYKTHTAKWDADLAESEHKARELEEQVEGAEHKAGRFDAGEALLQIAVVLASITLLTRQRLYWLVALTVGGVGTIFALFGYLAH